MSRWLLTVFFLLCSSAMVQAGDNFAPVPLGNTPFIPGFQYPESSATIKDWVPTSINPVGNLNAINLHSWGIWTRLNEDSGETFGGQSLRVWETWQSPSQIKSGSQTTPWPLDTPSNHDDEVLVSVRYSPEAAEFTVMEDLFNSNVLDQMIADGQTQIPELPARAITLKPVILPEILGDELQVVQPGFPGLYRLPFWDGPPNPAAKHGTSTWGQWIWIDLNEPGAGTGNGGVDTTGNTPTPENTYGLGRFIHFSTDDDVVRILVAMHVTTRETTRWTWATYWWSANPDIPQLPSSTSVANDRPTQLTGAARNYAMCTAYQMVTPGQPNTGGTNVGVSPVLCYNPWLEAGFSPSVLAPVNQLIPNPNYGVQTNCMSCHAMARYPHGGIIEFYSANQYIDIGPSLSDALRVDFTWSIPVNAAVPDDSTPSPDLAPIPIPSVSRWGTVLMGLLIIVIVNMRFRSRRNARGGM